MSLATSSPELLVSVSAVQQGQVWIAIGNIFGSYITNIGLVLGLTGLIRPIVVSKSHLDRQIPFCVCALVLVVILSIHTYFTWIDGMILLVLLGFWLGWLAVHAYVFKREHQEAVQNHLLKSIVWFIVGVACLHFGSKILVSSAQEIAAIYNISSLAVGLSIVAVGTSLPELSAALTSAYYGEFELLLGNIVGANLLLLLLILPVTVFTLGHPIPLSGVWGEYLFMAVLTGCLWIFSTYVDDALRINRYEASVLLGLFIVYQFFVYL